MYMTEQTKKYVLAATIGILTGISLSEGSRAIIEHFNNPPLAYQTSTTQVTLYKDHIIQEQHTTSKTLISPLEEMIKPSGMQSLRITK